MRKHELNLPKEALVNEFIAKSKFYEKSHINTKLQKEFVNSILKITWKYKLAESTIGLAKTDTVTEIQIFEVELKKMVLPLRVLKIIDKSIPYQILYRFLYNGNVSWGITLKENTIKALENKIILLESKIKKEKQLNRKVEINKVLLEKKD
jgi:hypothetical protein